MQGVIVRMLAHDGGSRLFLLDGSALARPICLELDGPVKAGAFACAYTLTALSAATLKEGQRISVTFDFGNEARITCDADANGDVRGYPNEEFQELLAAKEADLYGEEPVLRIVRAAPGGAMFTGVVQMPHRSIARDLAHYFTKSEQTDTALWHFYEQKEGEVRSLGLMLQRMPGRGMEGYDRAAAAISALSPDDWTAERLCRALDMHIAGEIPVRYHCPCSRALFLEILETLPVSELAGMLRERQLEAVCNVCGTAYRFEEQEIAGLIAKKAAAR